MKAPLSILVCGGAGYIGSHMTAMLAEAGHAPVVFDNLSAGRREAVGGAQLIEGDLLDRPALTGLFSRTRFDAVMHFAAKIVVSESVARPGAYYRNNVVGTLNLLDAMREAGVGRLVFSSTAAVYGSPRASRIGEDHPLAPVNPYGWTKRMAEQIMADHAAAYGLSAVAFRYFNAAGARADGTIGEAHDPETHLIPNLLLALLEPERSFTLYGDDYPTPDGTCIRDYVHVEDICRAHLAALDHMDRHPGFDVFNLGNGQGFSIRDVMASATRVTGSGPRLVTAPRRAGDAAVLVADSGKAAGILGWAPQHPDIDAIVASAWNWHRRQAFAGSRPCVI